MFSVPADNVTSRDLVAGDAAVVKCAAPLTRKAAVKWRASKASARSPKLDRVRPEPLTGQPEASAGFMPFASGPEPPRYERCFFIFF